MHFLVGAQDAMIAVSSFRPHAEDPNYARNQRRARQSWAGTFREVHYFGLPEPQLEHPNSITRFVGDGSWPLIKDMAIYAARQRDDYVAIINADIVVSRRIHFVEERMKQMGLPAATSYRYEFDASDPFTNFSTLVRNRQDRGMDIFIATPQIWTGVADKVPPYLRIGHQTWDTWVCGHFCSTLGLGFLQFTEERLIFHPRHDGRKTPHAAEIRNDDPCFTLAKQPSPMPL